jgi:hypothetical protein
MSIYHPMLDEHGRSVLLEKPIQPTTLLSWGQADSVATVIPNGDGHTERRLSCRTERYSDDGMA